MRDEMKSQGYSKEDEYFHKKDRELIAKLKEQADAQRAKLEAENRKKDHWMLCPRCGTKMKEEKYGNVVLVDRCSSKSCGGVFFDGGELEMLLKAKGSLIQKIFGR